MKIRGATIAGGLALAAALTLSTATAASAADSWQRTTDVADSTYNNGHAKVCATGSPVGIACFQPYGEWFWLRDIDTNGEPVVVEWNYFGSDGARNGEAYWDGGAAAGWTNLNKSYYDNGNMRFRVCEADLSYPKTIVYDTCSSWYTAIT
ncbi:hypothetical protein MRQ36_09935 [Micromonospora sp. R77]|uniref:hypothetical protein n=1 Tax=Micromonospora sp. R77 TaxID=2925836 RepID=UPI001F607620|nr:hypothetical protein [Micromonospora sp. R77]MCI4062874.1 hypothetical protein [Micromonospora sp. R77]